MEVFLKIYSLTQQLSYQSDGTKSANEIHKVP